MMLADVVDDDPGNRKLLAILVQRAGCRVRTHTTGEEALAAMVADPPAIAVLDVQLSGAVDGIALTRALRMSPRTMAVAIVVVSAFAGVADEARARAAGCDVWLSKPINTNEFVGLIARLAGVPDGGREVDEEWPA